jgi:hypothetical protein
VVGAEAFPAIPTKKKSPRKTERIYLFIYFKKNRVRKEKRARREHPKKKVNEILAGGEGRGGSTFTHQQLIDRSEQQQQQQQLDSAPLSELIRSFPVS